MAANPELVALLLDALAAAGGVTYKRMFSGGGLFRDGLMFALIVGDDLYLKVDGETEGGFIAEGLGVFEYDTSKGRKSLGTYRRAPERLLDDHDELLAWGRRAMDAARRIRSAKTGVGKRPSRPRGPANPPRPRTRTRGERA